MSTARQRGMELSTYYRALRILSPTSLPVGRQAAGGGETQGGGESAEQAPRVS